MNTNQIKNFKFFIVIIFMLTSSARAQVGGAFVENRLLPEDATPTVIDVITFLIFFRLSKSTHSA